MALALDIQSRDAKESTDTLRQRGVVPAVFYGPKQAATPISIDAKALERIWKEAGETTIITLSGVGESKDSLIHDMQFHPVTGALVHADFYVLEKGKKVKIEVPLEFVGNAPAEKQGHIITKVMHKVEIEVAPAELPHKLEVDLAVLQGVGDHITVSDIKLPPSASLITHGEEIVASVIEFKEESAEIAPAPETIIEGAAPETTSEVPEAGKKNEK